MSNLAYPSEVTGLPELAYDVTVVMDATASLSKEEMNAALEVNIPNYASAMVSTSDIVDALSENAIQPGVHAA